MDTARVSRIDDTKDRGSEINLRAGPSGMVRQPAFAPVVVGPTFNNCRTLPDVLRRIAALGLPMIIVNDGSTDSTASVLSDWTRRESAQSTTVVTHSGNRGKAAALRTGFQTARQHGFSHAATVDTDGQLDPEQIPALLDASRREPDALVLGVRGLQRSAAPGAHQLGWWMSALGIWLETGRRVLDSQCGLRVYSLHLFDAVRCRAGRFGFEAEVVTRAAWAGSPILEVPVTCRYFTGEQRVSHFRPWRDGVRNFLMHARLTLRRLVPWPHRALGQTAQRTPEASRMARIPLSRAIRDWLSPVSLWCRLRQDRFEQLLVAAALGIGTFMAAMPLGGWQILLAGYAAWRLRVHLLPTLLGSMLCIPPIGDMLGRVSIAVGYLLCHAQLPDLEVLDPATVGHWSLLWRVPLAWPVGAVIVGFFANWITIPAFVHVFRLIPVQSDPPAHATTH